MLWSVTWQLKEEKKEIGEDVMVTVSMYNILEDGEKTDDTSTVLKEQENEFCHFCLSALSSYGSAGLKLLPRQGRGLCGIVYS